MLEALRGFVGSWVAKIFLGVLIASFAVWGIAGEVFGPGSSNAVATVGETRVPPSRFLASYYATLENVRRSFGRQPTRQQARQLGIEQQALAQVVSAATLDEYARRLGVTLSDKQLARLISEQSGFQDSQGKFDRRRFQDAVRNARTNEETFIQDQNRAAVRAQIGSAAVAGDLVPEVYEKAALTHAGERRVFEVIEVTEAIAGTPPAPTDPQMTEWFAANTARYRAPEYRKLSLLKIEPADLAAPDDIDEERVKAEYERRIKAYTTEERRTIQQLPFPDREAAEKAAAAISEGVTFETVMADAKVSPEVANLGKLERARVPDPAIAEAAFSLPLNETSGIVDGRFGPVLVRVIEIEPGQVQPLSEVEGELRQGLALQEAAKRVADLYGEIEDARAGGATVAEIASSNGLEVRSIERVDAAGLDADGKAFEPALPAASNLLAEVFQTEVGAPTNAVTLGSTGYVWFDVEEIEPARDRTLDEVRDRVIADWTQAEKIKLLDAKAKEIAEAIEGGETVNAITSTTQAATSTTEPLARNANAPKIGREGVQAGFEGTVGSVSVASPSADLRSVIRVAEIVPPAEVSKQEGSDDRTREVVASDLLQQVIARLQGEYGATVNQPLVQASLNRY